MASKIFRPFKVLVLTKHGNSRHSKIRAGIVNDLSPLSWWMSEDNFMIFMHDFHISFPFLV
jgi:hypothetical protein